jgi:glutathione peroxidase
MKRSTFLLTIPLLLTTLQSASAADLLQIPVKDIAGKETNLAALSGKAVLVVNVASKCGYTRQYAGLESLYKAYKDKGLVVVGFPSNDFGAQEPGTEAEILQFCTSKYSVTFPLYSKVTVKGDSAHPLFTALTGPAGGAPGPVKWNFNKFLLGRDGVLKARFDSTDEPDGELMTAAIERALASTVDSVGK